LHKKARGFKDSGDLTLLYYELLISLLNSQSALVYAN